MMKCKDCKNSELYVVLFRESEKYASAVKCKKLGGMYPYECECECEYYEEKEEQT